MKKSRLIVMVVIIFCISNTVHAHDYLQAGIMDWGDDIGWSIKETRHIGETSFDYRLDPNDSYISTYSSVIASGESWWSSVCTINKVTDSAVEATVSTYYEVSSVIAKVTNWTLDSDGHIYHCDMMANRNCTQTARVWAHEFGHVIGSAHVVLSSNDDKVMYYLASSGVTSCTSEDLMGAKVILGSHYSHSWTYDGNSGSATHFRECSYCSGYKDEACDPETGTCNYCGYFH